MLNPLRDVHGTWLQVWITLCCCSGFLLFGYDQGVFSGVQTSEYFLETFNHPDPNLLGLINAIFDVGGAFGGILCIFIGTLLGRRRTIFVGCVVTIVGAILTGTAKKTAQLLVGRIVSGLGVGMLTSTVGIFQAETAEARIRGRLMAIQLLLCATGLFLSQWINYGFGNDKSKTAFMFPLFFQIVFLAVTLAVVMMLPESPRWLVSRQRMADAKASMLRLAPAGTPEDDPEINRSLNEMEEIALLEDVESWEWFVSLFKPNPGQSGKRVGMACAISAFQQLSGVNSITYYVPTLLTTFIGTSRSDSLWIAGLTSVISWTFAWFPVLFIERLGRIPILIAGAMMQAVCFFIVAGCFAHLPEVGSDNSKSFGIAIVSFVYIYFAIFSATWLGPSWMYPAEIVPLKGRSHGMGLANVFYWMFNFLIVQITPTALNNISWKYYIILGIFNVSFVPVLWFFPETKGKTLEELDLYFAERFHGGKELAEFEKTHQTHFRHSGEQNPSKDLTKESVDEVENASSNV